MLFGNFCGLGFGFRFQGFTTRVCGLGFRVSVMNDSFKVFLVIRLSLIYLFMGEFEVFHAKGTDIIRAVQSRGRPTF